MDKGPGTYQVTLTPAMVKSIRSLYFHADMICLRSRATNYINEQGEVAHRTIHECLFCHQGSYESPGAIVHSKKCWWTELGPEIAALNAQFFMVEHPEAKTEEEMNNSIA